MNKQIIFLVKNTKIFNLNSKIFFADFEKGHCRKIFPACRYRVEY